MDIVSSVLMHLPKELLTAAQVEDRACSRLVGAVEKVAEFTSSMESHKVSNIAFSYENRSICKTIDPFFVIYLDLDNVHRLNF